VAVTTANGEVVSHSRSGRTIPSHHLLKGHEHEHDRNLILGLPTSP